MIAAMLTATEIYRSIQGETTRAGEVCAFVRLTGCDLRCSYCDSAYAFKGGEKASVTEVVEQTVTLQTQLVTVTGGEPLLQEDVFPLITTLCDRGKTVLVETSGAHSIARIDPRAIVILDWKCPSSGEAERNLAENLALLKAKDEVKFVIATREDYDWARGVAKQLPPGPAVLFTWATPPADTAELKPVPSDHRAMSLRELADAVVADNLPVRLLPQVHKVVWGADAKAR